MKSPITKVSAGVIVSSFLLFSMQAFAAMPVQPNCLGNDVMVFAQALTPLGKNVVQPLSGGGFDNEILAHLQGIPGFSSCPDGGFPTPLH